ncbi:MAG: hypothetical protein AAFV96_00580 [Pseudomonadota bacterium]
MFDRVDIEGRDIRVRMTHPRHRRPLDVVLLTDQAGTILDLGVPGYPAASALRLGGNRLMLEDTTLVFQGALEDTIVRENGFYLYALFSGTVSGHVSPPSRNTRRPAMSVAAPGETQGPSPLEAFALQVNVPFLEHHRAPPCTPDEALALGIAPEKVVAGIYADLLGRSPSDEETTRHLGDLGRHSGGAVEIALDIGASEEFQTRICRHRLAPKLSAFRRRTLRLGHPSAAVLSDGAQSPAVMLARTPEEAFRLLGFSFDPRVWNEGFYDRRLSEADHDTARFAKSTPPLSLFSA